MPLVDDQRFDMLLPPDLQVMSWMHFTPIEVARRAARLLAPTGTSSVLDVGSGPGKFCLIAADELPRSRFTGVELRDPLVAIASGLARWFDLRNASFVHADAFALDWTSYDAFYLYNPFAEQISGNQIRIDRTFAYDPARFVASVDTVRHRLACARIGTRVATFHGFGASPPYGYELASSEWLCSGPLELWVKTRAAPEYVA